MPELPEVETVRRDLAKHLIDATFSKIKILDFKNVAPEATFLAKFLKGKEVLGVGRKGKLLIIDLKNSNHHLLVHLKMTGQLVLKNRQESLAGGHSLSEKSFNEAIGGDLPNKFTRAIFTFKNGSTLFFNDMRKFGYIKLVDDKELALILINNYGLEPLDGEFNFEYLKSILKNRKAPVKAIILNQKLIAGLGNIYADESLFLAGIRPWRLASSLKTEEIKILVKVIKKVIKKAILARGTTFKDFVDGKGNKGGFVKQLKVYQRQNKPCLLCSNTILKKKVAGRGTHYCSACQK
jgi:formamidopyrimidine-DNA glycosylase